MKFYRWCSVAAAALLTVLSVDASAQKIRNYQQQAVDSYGGAAGSERYDAKGGPQAVQAAPVVKSAATEEKSEDGEPTVENSYALQNSGAARTTSSGTAKKLNLKPEELYRGVIPGTRDEVDHLAKAKKKGESSTNRLMWIGFQPRDNSTRVFLQFAREAQYEVSSGENGDVIVTLSNTKLSERNFARFLDTSYFNRNVQRIQAKKTGRNEVQVSIKLAKSERPQVNSTQSYVYLEFSGKKLDEKADKQEKKDSESEGGYGAMDE